MNTVVRVIPEDIWHPLPPRVCRKHGAYYFVHKHAWVHLGRSGIDARKRFKALAGERGIPHVDTDFIRALHFRAMRRAKRKNVEWAITAEDVERMWVESKGRCALTGIPFDEANTGSFARRPWIPSLDRKESTKGYTPENTRLICCAMNFALNAWGEQIFEHVAREFLARR